jgi:hypothetical protein
MQPPLEQRWPAGHAAFMPHLQVPLAQLSESVPHVCVQVPPPGPQLAVPSGTQPEPLLHEFASQTQPLVGSQTWLAPHCAPLHAHTPLKQVSLMAVQSRQLEPVVPHCLSLTVAMQVLASAQQPLQEVLVQTQLPLTHARPAPHCALLPHLHWPPAQLSALPAAHGVHAVPSVAQPIVGEGVVQV